MLRFTAQPVAGKGRGFTDVTLGKLKERFSKLVAREMKAKKISRAALARRLRTSRSQIGRLLDPKDSGVTLRSLFRTLRAVGYRLEAR